MQAINPATGDLIRDYPEHSPAQAGAALDRAAAAFAGWRDQPVAARAAQLRRVAGALRAESSGLAGLMTAEMGKTVVAAEAEVAKCALACDWFADHAAQFLTPQAIATEASSSYVRYDALGLIL